MIGQDNKTEETVMKLSHSRSLTVLTLIMAAALSVVASKVNALTAGETYSITMSKVNSDGTVTAVDSVSTTANAAGKITFSFNNVPTNPTTFFLVLTIKDSTNAVVRKSFVPAPPELGAGQLGVNDLSTHQTNMLLQALAGAGTDDPIVVAYGLILTRTPNLTETDIGSIATLGKLAIIGGFETFLTDNGVSASQLTTFKQKLIYNQPNRDLSNFTALFKSAIDNPAQASDDMALAAGLIADIFIDAGLAAGIDLGLILAAHDATGEVVETNPEAGAALVAMGSDVQNVIDQAMSSFFLRIAAVKVKTSYSNALTTLNASGNQVERFNNAVQTMVTAMEDLDKQNAQYFESPELMTAEIRTQMDAAYANVFNSFQSDIASTVQEIADMKANIASALRIPQDNLPAALGTYRNMAGTTVNWPIPQVVATNWVANVISNGGALVYDRATAAAGLPVPANMGWLNGTGTRSDFVTMGFPASFAALMGMQEDLQIAEMIRFYLRDPANGETGGDPTRDQEKEAKLLYTDHVELIEGSLSGTTNGSTPITTAQIEALVKMMEHPSLY